MENDDMPYTNREIRERWFDIANKLSELSTDMSVGFSEMKTRQDTTNGNVKKLQLWRAFMTGGMSVIVIIVLPLLAWALYVLANIQTEVHMAVDQALSAYNLNTPK